MKKTVIHKTESETLTVLWDLLCEYLYDGVKAPALRRALISVAGVKTWREFLEMVKDVPDDRGLSSPQESGGGCCTPLTGVVYLPYVELPKGVYRADQE